ncbi:hypothetical protein [Agromyces atrinae]|uniref:SRPBCC family protein n=1 Tax=Agromyces atrinae TaxID=592376 RepID=A0A4Q2M8A1_9MICO|nr:hypothetical protein [Agromyces atrinae]NYD66922.1 hypothetical protein [Agromyces atrinae]RXZ87567.1 hypothetical protein ESP50_06540 [Agromyces atrinae]
MRVLLKTTLDCSADVAWRAIRSPAILQEVVTPWLQFTSLEPGGFPAEWPGGRHRMRTTLLGVIPAGDEAVDLSYSTRGDVRIQRDSGGAESGPLAAFHDWDHRIAISPLPDGRTLYRDQLLAEGPIIAWPAAWAFWQWRALRLRALAPGWATHPALR